MSSGNTGSSYKPAPQYSPDDLGIYPSSNVETSEEVMRFIKHLYQRTEIAMEPQEAFTLVAEAGGNDQLALRRYLSNGLPTTSMLPDSFPAPHEPPPPEIVQGADRQRCTDKVLKDSSAEGEKKRCGLTKVLRRRKGVS